MSIDTWDGTRRGANTSVSNFVDLFDLGEKSLCHGKNLDNMFLLYLRPGDLLQTQAEHELDVSIRNLSSLMENVSSYMTLDGEERCTLK